MIREEYVYQLSKEKSTHVGQATTCVPSDELDEIIRKEMARQGATIEDVSLRVGEMLGTSPDAVYRRFCSIRMESLVNDLSLADALLIALDLSLADTDLPVLAGSKRSARKLVEAYAESNPMSEEEIDTISHLIARFTIGYIHAPALLGDEDAIRKHAYRTELQRKRRERMQEYRTKRKERKRERVAA